MQTPSVASVFINQSIGHGRWSQRITKVPEDHECSIFCDNPSNSCRDISDIPGGNHKANYKSQRSAESEAMGWVWDTRWFRNSRPMICWFIWSREKTCTVNTMTYCLTKIHCNCICTVDSCYLEMWPNVSERRKTSAGCNCLCFRTGPATMRYLCEPQSLIITQLCWTFDSDWSITAAAFIFS